MASEGPTEAVEPRDAASVIVLRDADGPPEIYFLRRHARMAFAPGVLVFPGGAVDEADYRSAGPVAVDWGDRLGLEPSRAGAVVAAAIREVEEETGLRLEERSMHPWACWVTPTGVPRRYRTWFFIAALPAGQAPLDISGEADAVMWLTPEDALRAARDGEVDLWPPQYAACKELLGVRSVEAAFEVAVDREVSQTFPPARFVGDDNHLGGS